jgi:signal transduction histidine kinase
MVGPLRRTSITRKAPLFLGLLLLVALVSLSVLQYFQVRRILLEQEEVRLRGTAELLVQLVGQALGTQAEEVGRTAADPALRAFLASPGDSSRADEAGRVLRAEVDLTGNGLGWTLFDAEGRCVLAAWRRTRADREVLTTTECPPTGVPLPVAPEPGVTPLLGGEDGNLRYGVVVAVPGAEDGATVGWVMSEGSVSTDQGTVLIAEDARVVFGNRAGSGENEPARDLPTELRAAPGASVLFSMPEGERLGAGAALAATPWGIWIHRDVNEVLEPARLVLGASLASTLVVLALGTLAGFLVTRRFTEPLAHLSEAAAGLGAGDYGRRVVVQRTDEVGRVGESFNLMASALQQSHEELEERVATRTIELRRTVAELRETQEELVRRERLAILGQLAGGVGHELRNPLGVITNAVFYLSAVLDDASPKVREYLGILEKQVGIAQKIISDLLDFARQRDAERKPVQLDRLLTEVEQRVKLPAGVRMIRDIPDDLPAALADPDQVAQILVNLLTNAAQAMPDEEGAVTARARTVGEGEVRLEVIDTGEGISPANLGRVFEPLFTTRARGIGLGLAVSRSLALANGGDLSVESTPGEGSRFTLTLPASAARASAAVSS